MAFLMARVCSNAFERLKTKFSPFYTESINVSRRQYKRNPKRWKPETERKPSEIPGRRKYRNLIESSFESLAARDFLRSYKPYTPPPHVKEKVVDICLRFLGTNYSSSAALSRETKFEILNTCFNEIQHSVPNSKLHTITTADDIIRFYETPVSTTTPYDEMKNKNLPPNLCIQYDYKRFDPTSDSVFGITAFPESSNIVSGLNSKRKYKGFKAPLRPLIDDEEFFTKESVFKTS